MSAAAQSRITEFFTTERNRLVSYVRRLIDDAAERDGEDIVQDVALNLFSKADVTIPIENLSAYVYQAIRNRVVDYMRRQRNVLSLYETLDENNELSLAEVISDPALETEVQVGRSEIRRQVYEAIERLSDVQKAVMIETEFQGRSFQELSRLWGVPIGTLLARKSRAVAKVRAALEDLRP